MDAAALALDPGAIARMAGIVVLIITLRAKLMEHVKRL
jgi:hypothetical protein